MSIMKLKKNHCAVPFIHDDSIHKPHKLISALVPNKMHGKNAIKHFNTLFRVYREKPY